MRLRQHTKPAANPQKTWQNSNAALPIVYLFFIIYLKSIEWAITKLENLSGVYVECYRFLIFIVTDSVYYKYQDSKTYIPTVVSITEIIEYYKNGYMSATVGTRLHLASG